MIEMKEQIYEIIKTHPGLRKREIAGYVKASLWDVYDSLNELKAENRICSKVFRDFANMDFYDKWYIRG